MSEQILGRRDGSIAGNGRILTVTEIGSADLNAVRDVLYPGNTSADEPMYLNQAWPGILLLGVQKQNFLPRLVASGDSPTTADNLWDFQDLLFAWDAFRHSFEKTGAFDMAIAKDLAISMGLVRWEDIPGAAQNVDNPKWWFDFLIAKQDAYVGELLRNLHDIGAARYLDMLRGARNGELVIGETTAANFVTAAQNFFNAQTYVELIGIAAKALPATPDQLAKLARSDVNVRAALQALSEVSVELVPAVTGRFER